MLSHSEKGEELIDGDTYEALEAVPLKETETLNDGYMWQISKNNVPYHTKGTAIVASRVPVHKVQG
jgi:hypothetical protein